VRSCFVTWKCYVSDDSHEDTAELSSATWISLTSQSERLTKFRRLVCATLVRLSSHQVGEHRFEDVIFLVETSENSCPQLETLYDVNRMVHDGHRMLNSSIGSMFL